MCVQAERNRREDGMKCNMKQWRVLSSVRAGRCQQLGRKSSQDRGRKPRENKLGCL